MYCEKHSDAWSVTADFVFRGDRRSACGDIRQSGQLAYLFDLLRILYSFQSVVHLLWSLSFNVSKSFGRRHMTVFKAR